MCSEADSNETRTWTGATPLALAAYMPSNRVTRRVCVHGHSLRWWPPGWCPDCLEEAGPGRRLLAAETADELRDEVRAVTVDRYERAKRRTVEDFWKRREDSQAAFEECLFESQASHESLLSFLDSLCGDGDWTEE